MASPLLQPFERGNAFKQLKELLGSDHPPLALIGSGASMSSGYPSWAGLIAELANLVGAKSLIPQRSQALAEDLIWAAEAYRRDIPKKDFAAYITERFGPADTVGEPYHTLVTMSFRHFLTTNYDPCVEVALQQRGEVFDKLEWHDKTALSKFLINFARRNGKKCVVYLHGRFSSPDQIILTETSYVQRYIADDDARRKLLAIFMTHPVVFIGFSMSDPDFAMVMREVTARLQSNPPCHYAILGYGSEPEREVYRDRMRGKFGVEPVFYSYADNHDKHTNLVSLLRALNGMDAVEGPRKEASSSLSRLNIADPLDPQKGRWGGTADNGGRRLRVLKTGGSKAQGWLEFDLIVEAIKGSPPLRGEVVFHLHPTFDEPTIAALAEGDTAILERCVAYGAFTVGVSCDGGQTKLELDLARVKSLPTWFRRR